MRIRAFPARAARAPLIVLLAFSARDAGAVGTRTFELDSLERLSGGDLEGASIGSDGVVRAGWTLGNVPLPGDAGTTSTCAVTLPDGSVLLGTGPASGGKVIRIAGDQATIFADTKESAVSALAVDRAGTVYAATTSDKIYKVRQGRAEVFATIKDATGVFALAADTRSNALYAGTGPKGTVVRIDPSGASSVYFETDAPFVVSIAVGDDGAVYAGTSGKGLLYKISAVGRASVLYDFPGDDSHTLDVHAIALGADHSVWAIANETTGSAPAEPSESPARHNAGGRTPPGPAGPTHVKPGKGSLWHFDARGRPEKRMHHDEFHYVSLALDERGAPFVGTGAEGRVYTVDDAHVVSLVADTDERQIGAIGVAGKTRYAIGSDPAVYHRVLAVGGAGSVWTSKALDAGIRARYGHMGWRATGSVEVETRTGDTQTPDVTWSAWSHPIPDGGLSPSPAGRFFQVRARLRDANATVADMTIPYVTENLRAVVTEVTAHQRGSARVGKEGPSGGEPPKHDSVVHVSWKVENPDGDELRYRVAFQQLGQSRWVDANRPEEVLTKQELDWDTATLPEGKYRVRVDASDELSNPPGDVTHHALEAPLVLVDNAPPVFKALTTQGRRLRAEVVDGLGPITRVEVAFDGRLEWRPLAPVDGIFDTADESVDADMTPLLPAGVLGPHVVAVRAYDGVGNSVVREVAIPKAAHAPTRAKTPAARARPRRRRTLGGADRGYGRICGARGDLRQQSRAPARGVNRRRFCAFGFDECTYGPPFPGPCRVHPRHARLRIQRRRGPPSRREADGRGRRRDRCGERAGRRGPRDPGHGGAIRAGEPPLQRLPRDRLLSRPTHARGGLPDRRRHRRPRRGGRRRLRRLPSRRRRLRSQPLSHVRSARHDDRGPTMHALERLRRESRLRRPRGCLVLRAVLLHGSVRRFVVLLRRGARERHIDEGPGLCAGNALRAPRGIVERPPQRDVSGGRDLQRRGRRPNELRRDRQREGR